MHKQLTIDVFKQDLDLRGNVAESANASIPALAKLAHDDWEVRCCVARGPNTPITLLERLALDENCHVRCNVAENVNTPDLTIKELARDERHMVQQAIQHRAWAMQRSKKRN